MGKLEDTPHSSSFELIWEQKEPDDETYEEFLLFDPVEKRFIQAGSLHDPFSGVAIGYVDLRKKGDLKEALEILAEAYQKSGQPEPDLENAYESWRRWKAEGFPSTRKMDERTREGLFLAADALFHMDLDLRSLRHAVVFLSEEQKHRVKELKKDYGIRDVRLVEAPEEALLEFLLKMDLGRLVGPREWLPRKRRVDMNGLEDIPLPPDIPRPEMWDLEAVVRAVQDGYTFLLPFKMGESLFTPNAYWIAGMQASASGLTVGPEHTPKMEILPDGWLQAETFFMPDMVPERAWLAPPNKYGVVPVHVEIDPDTVDWDLLNRGHQIRTRRLL